MWLLQLNSNPRIGQSFHGIWLLGLVKCSLCMLITFDFVQYVSHGTLPLLPCEDDEDNSDTCSRALLSLPENSKIYQLRGLPKELRSLYCPGSSHGWLVMVDEATSVYLINPLTKAQLPLPPVNKFRDVLEYQPYKVSKVYKRCPRFKSSKNNPLRIYKVVLSSSPLSSSLMSSSQFQFSNVVAVAIFRRYDVLAFSRPGDRAWTILASEGVRFEDVFFYKDHLYAVRGCENWEILVFNMGVDVGGGCLVPKLVDTLRAPQGYNYGGAPLLVESCGDLLMVARTVGMVTAANNRRIHVIKTNGFKVFKVCSGDGDEKKSSIWVEIKNLGDRVLFLGLNSSVSFSAHDFPGCKGNCIYFTHHGLCDRYYSKRGWDLDLNDFDMGVFNLEDESIEAFPLQGGTGSSSSSSGSSRGQHPLLKLRPPPIWLFPNPN